MNTSNSYAIETAPRISDREIIESLAELKAGQRLLNQRFDDQDKRLNQRFDAQDKRFDAQDKRFDAQDKRFDDFNRRLDSIERTMLALFGTMISLIIAIFAYIAWDRRTAMRPMQKRIEVLEQDIAHDLELSNKMGSRLTRVVEALRRLAKTNPQVAEILRSFSLL
jgi:methyl-accepting chemotaxis protein